MMLAIWLICDNPFRKSFVEIVVSCQAGFYAAAGKMPRFWWGHHTNRGFSRN